MKEYKSIQKVKPTKNGAQLKEGIKYCETSSPNRTELWYCEAKVHNCYFKWSNDKIRRQGFNTTLLFPLIKLN